MIKLAKEDKDSLLQVQDIYNKCHSIMQKLETQLEEISDFQSKTITELEETRELEKELINNLEQEHNIKLTPDVLMELLGIETRTV